jgi:hypothetical protein
MTFHSTFFERNARNVDLLCKLLGWQVGTGAEGVGCQNAMWNALLGLEVELAGTSPSTGTSSAPRSYRVEVSKRLWAANRGLLKVISHADLTSG